MPMSAVCRPASRSPPARAPSTHVDVRERTVCARRAIDTNAAGQFRMLPFDVFDRLQDHLRVARIDPAVVIEIGHAAASVIDVDVSGIAVHVPAQLSASADATTVSVVPGSAGATHHDHPLYVDAVLLEMSDDELQLVDEVLVENHVLRPHVALIVGEEVREAKVLRDLHALVLG